MDLFAHAGTPTPLAPVSSPVSPVLPVPSLPSGTIAWQRIIDGLQVQQLTMTVITLWTREVLEVASDPVIGRRMLMRDGTIRDLPPDSAHGRIAYLTASRAQDLHHRHGLALVGRPGTISASFRFAATDAEATARVAKILSDLAERTPP